MHCRVLRFRCDFMFPLCDCHMKLSASYAMSVAVSFLTFSSQFGLTRFALLNFLAWYCRYLPGQGMERARLELSLHSWIQIYVLTCHIINFYANGLWCLTAHPPTHPHTGAHTHGLQCWHRRQHTLCAFCTVPESCWVWLTVFILFACLFIRLKNENVRQGIRVSIVPSVPSVCAECVCVCAER